MRYLWIRAIILVIFGLTQAVAQTAAGVNGQILDSSGALVPGAAVTITNLETGAQRETVTSETGSHQFPLLQPVCVVRSW